LKSIRFYDGVAALDIPWTVARRMKFRAEQRAPSERLERLKRSIRANGYTPFDPIICRVGPKRKKWHVIDGGHRLTAARAVSRELWTNLFGRKVQRLYILVLATAEDPSNAEAS
jgi:hypothetical protein